MKIFFQKIVLVFILFFVILNDSESQTFSIDVKSHYGLSQEIIYNSSIEYTNQRPTFDSTQIIIEETNSIANFTYKFSPKPGFGIHGNIRFHKNKFSIKTGIGIDYFAFSQKFISINSFETIIKSRDTINQEFISNLYQDNCSLYENEYSDIEIDPASYFKIINLRIPLVAEYMIIPKKLLAGIGIQLQTPLYSELKSEFISTESNIKNKQKTCKYIKQTNIIKNQTGISNTQIKLTGYATYYLFDKIGLELGYSAHIRNIFSPNNQYFGLVNEYTPFAIFVGIEYKFGQSINSSQKNK